ncbi:YbjQ family protein [Xanthomonas arboricola]|uniref:YbjQ family protein n=1 Tax=Xanthomonas arboricola TaxID=56448 RepID=UPI00141ADC8C|nr:YbjQ family protein [Xanthomonas arboricola]
MYMQSLIRNAAIAAATVALLAGCASSSKVMLGQARAPIDPSLVQVYSNAPVGSVEIAQLESTSAAGFGTQGQTDAAVQRLKREAAKLGANGVVIVGVDSERSGGGLSVGGGSYGGRVGGGLGIGIPTTQKRAAGMAIWVPAGARDAARSPPGQ